MSTYTPRVKWAVWAWATRLGLSTFGIFIPSFIQLLRMFFFPAADIVFLPLEELEWLKIMEPFLSSSSSSSPQLLHLFDISTQPKLIRHVPVPTPASIDYILNTVLPHTAAATRKSVKVSESALFTYHSSTRAWSSKYNLSGSAARFEGGGGGEMMSSPLSSSPLSTSSSTTPSSSSSSFVLLSPNEIPYLNPKINSCIESEVNSSSADSSSFHTSYSCNQHWYYTLPIPSPFDSPLLSTIAPSFVLAFSSMALAASSRPLQVLAPEVRLWMASENATAAPHYDMEDNFFLQLKGQKTFTISSPGTFKHFQPYSALHPRWRQARQSHLITAASIRKMILESANATTVFDTPDPPPSRSQQHRNVSTEGVWEVTLHPGDMLLLPAFYFHSVVTGRGSLSVSAWVKSKPSRVYDKLLKEELPYKSYDTDLGQRLAALGATLRYVVRVYSSASSPYLCRFELASILLSRVEGDVGMSKCGETSEGYKGGEELTKFKSHAAVGKEEEKEEEEEEEEEEEIAQVVVKGNEGVVIPDQQAEKTLSRSRKINNSKMRDITLPTGSCTKTEVKFSGK